MDTLTQVLIGVTILAGGLATLGVAFVSEADASYRYVEDLTRDPAGHTGGRFTLLGVPHASDLPAQTRRVTMWTAEGAPRQSEVLLSVAPSIGGDSTRWSVENRTRAPGTANADASASLAQWDVAGAHAAFRVRGFAQPGVEPEEIWAIYRGLLAEPLPPKPSQFEGRLLATLPDGTPLPPGVLVYEVDAYTVGCSSKLLPPGVES